jgi:hypothetical protein
MIQEEVQTGKAHLKTVPRKKDELTERMQKNVRTT